MDEEGIGLVLARATELRFNIRNCIHRGSPGQKGPQMSQEQGDAEEVNETEEDSEATERLLNVCDALESLESQLSSLQAMRQNQQYEREVALADIEYSRKTLLDKLKQFGSYTAGGRKNLEVIQEAVVFASETVEQSSASLLLPPSSTSTQNGNGYDLTNNKPQKSHARGIVHIIGTVAKTVVTLIGVVSILRSAGGGFRQDAPFPAALNMFLQPLNNRKPTTLECPPGKVLTVEDGQVRCLVKERVEVPFESSVSMADVNYGCG